MNRSTKLLWLAFVLFVPLGMMWEFYPLLDASARVDAFPRKTSRMEAHDVPLVAAEQTVFARVSVLKRFAVVGDDQAMVTVIDGTHNRHAVHDPVFCFRGAGWDVSAQESIPLDHGTAKLVHLKQGASTAESLYWFSDGKTQFSRPLTYWWKTALRRLTFGASGLEPVLVILTSTDDKPPNWTALLKAWPELQKL